MNKLEQFSNSIDEINKEYKGDIEAITSLVEKALLEYLTNTGQQEVVDLYIKGLNS